MKKQTRPQLTRIEATADGEVQRVGYRYTVQDIARKLSVKGYVQNMPDGTVKIIAEAPAKTIQKFIKALKIKEPPTKVRQIKVKSTKPTAEFEHFTIKYGDLNEEMAEGFSTGLKYMNLSRAESKQGFGSLSKEMQQGFQKLDTHTQKGFETTKAEISGMRQDINKNFKDMSTKYDKISDNLSQAIKIIQEESIKTRNEMIRAVDNLSKLVEEFVKRNVKN